MCRVRVDFLVFFWMKNGAAQKKNTYHSNQPSQVIPFNDSVTRPGKLNTWLAWKMDPLIEDSHFLVKIRIV